MQLVGMKFDRLTIVSGPFIRHRNLKDGRQTSDSWVECECSCGKFIEVKAYHLFNKDTTSCGCYRREITMLRSKTHGKSKTKEYIVWAHIIARCYDEKTKGYENYGGRGIKMCHKWRNSFDEFFKDMGLRPSSDYSIERIDVNGNYEPSNCKWVKKTDQSRNQRTNRIVMYNGVEERVCVLAQKHGLSSKKVLVRLDKLGWDIHDALKQ